MSQCKRQKQKLKLKCLEPSKEIHNIQYLELTADRLTQRDVFELFSHSI